MVFDYKVLPVTRKILDAPSEIKGFIDRRKTVTRKLRRNRRKAVRDRRKSVRDGVIVNLSFKDNRRRGGDRRRAGGRLPGPSGRGTRFGSGVYG